MKVIYPNALPTQMFGRNPIYNVYSYSAAGIVPHATTVRWNYTVPTGRLAMLLGGMLWAGKKTNGAPNGYVTMKIVALIFALSTVLYICEYNFSGINQYLQYILPWGGVYGATMQVFATTQDLSTGGAVDYVLSMQIVEYDE